MKVVSRCLVKIVLAPTHYSVYAVPKVREYGSNTLAKKVLMQAFNSQILTVEATLYSYG
jgi:hypothetical protein